LVIGVPCLEWNRFRCNWIS